MLILHHTRTELTTLGVWNEPRCGVLQGIM